MNAHIYLVANSVNGKQYVGQTTNSSNKLGHGRVLLKAYKAHGKDNFSYERICSDINNRATLNYIERFWIQVMGSVAPNGYNVDLGGSEGSVWTEERKKQRSIQFTGKKLNRPLGSKSGMKGKAYPEEGKRKLSEAMKGNKHSLGKKHSAETKAKMSASQKEYWVKMKESKLQRGDE